MSSTASVTCPLCEAMCALMRGKDRCTLLIHPDDARRVGVRSGDVAEVSTCEGMVAVPANLLNPAHLIDVPSGTQVVNGVPCRVRNRP